MVDKQAVTAITERSGWPYTVAFALIALLVWSLGGHPLLVAAAAFWSGSNFGWDLHRNGLALMNGSYREGTHNDD